MWEQCMDADASLLRLHRIDGIFRFVALFVDGEDAKRGDGFKRVVGPRMHHAHANRSEVPGVNEGNCR